MVSSTFTDLQEHRTALIGSIHSHKLHANVMENDSARLVDVIDSSLQLVRDSAAYIGIISLKYGQTPECPKRNPGQHSITELEFNEAQRLERPLLLYIMGDDHPVKKADIERDPEKETKLNAFRERAKAVLPDSSVQRVYAVFNSLQDFKDKLGSSLVELSKYLESTMTMPLRTNRPSKGATSPPSLTWVIFERWNYNSSMPLKLSRGNRQSSLSQNFQRYASSTTNPMNSIR